MKVPIDHLDRALLRALNEKPPREEGWIVHELTSPLCGAGLRRSDDTYRNRLRRLRDIHALVATARVKGEPGSPMAYSLTDAGRVLVAEVVDDACR